MRDAPIYHSAALTAPMFHVKLFFVEHSYGRRENGLDPWYVTGLTEGEGSFTFSRSGRGVTLYFSLRARRGARPLVEGLRAFFDGAGRIYETGGSLYYRVTRRRELERVAAHFDVHRLRGPKADAYAVWRRLLHVKQSPRGERAFEELGVLAAELRQRAPRRRRAEPPT